MPYYDFKCVSCEHTQEELVKMGTNESICEKCGAKAEKSMSSYRFNATGLPNGFASTRSRKKGEK
jgi:putative FmdB family regulatory protein